MDRLFEIWDAVVTWMMEHGEEPLFNLTQGVVLGLVIAGAVWMLCKAFKVEADDE
ncbi:MAG: hypothetical protein K5663_11240 [Clostridiales bacterium]|nr:hypothetical protein [Clostridiales bacterium]